MAFAFYVEKEQMKPLPCPFCGATPRLRPINPKVEGDAWGSVRCANFDCPVSPEVFDNIDVADDRGSEKYIENAIRRWNKRA